MMDINIKEAISATGSERAILMLILQDVNNILECEGLGLRPFHFSIDAHMYIYATVCFLTTQGVEKIDSIALMNSLPSNKAKDSIEEMGGIDYINLLFTSRLQSNVKVYVANVIESYNKVELYNMAKKTQDQVLDENIKTSEVISDLQKEISDLVLSNNTTTIHKIGTGLRERLLDRFENPQDTRGYRVGWNKFDMITQGFYGNDLTFVVAPSKTGKSLLLMNWGIKLAESGLNVLEINTEMGDEQTEERILSCLSGVCLEEIGNGKCSIDTFNGLGVDKMEKLDKAMVTMKDLNYWHEFIPNFDYNTVLSKCRKYKMEHNIDVIIFDHLKVPQSDMNKLNSVKEYQLLTFYCIMLKDLSGELGLPVISASQTNRNDLTPDKPTAKDIGGSLGVLQNATKVFFLYNKTMEEMAQENGELGNQRLHIAFQRSGASEYNGQLEEPIHLSTRFSCCSMKEVG